jgi:hypothetical protein
MNLLEVTGGAEAKLKYDVSDYRIIKHGDFVRCAVTGRAIALEDLKYWNPERQEAYVDADASLKAEQKAGTLK